MSCEAREKRAVVPPPLPTHVRQGSVAATVSSLPRGTRPTEVWRSAAYAILRLNPEECAALGQVFEDEAISDPRRMLILDLLAGAGTFEAQVVVRRVLSLAIARRDSRTFATYVQRLGFVEHPDGPTLRYLMSVLGESRHEAPDVRASCAYALGAAAGHALAAGDFESAFGATEPLRRELAASRTPAEIAALLAALGNAGMPSDEPTFLRYAADRSAPVRAASGLALRLLLGRVEAAVSASGSGEHRIVREASMGSRHAR